FVLGTVEGDRAAVAFDDCLDNGQTEAAARDVCRRAAAEETVEELLLFALRDPAAGVAHRRESGAVAFADRNSDVSAGRRELDRIRDEVVEDLADALGIVFAQGSIPGSEKFQVADD